MSSGNSEVFPLEFSKNFLWIFVWKFRRISFGSSEEFPSDIPQNFRLGFPLNISNNFLWKFRRMATGNSEVFLEILKNFTVANFKNFLGKFSNISSGNFNSFSWRLEAFHSEIQNFFYRYFWEISIILHGMPQQIVIVLECIFLRISRNYFCKLQLVTLWNYNEFVWGLRNCWS